MATENTKVQQPRSRPFVKSLLDVIDQLGRMQQVFECQLARQALRATLDNVSDKDRDRVIETGKAINQRLLKNR